MSEYKGKAGTIYVEQRPKQSEDDKPYEVWFEDFCIIGNGDSELEALEDAVQHALDIAELANDAITKFQPPQNAAASGG